MYTFDNLRGQCADLDTDKRTDEHSHRQCVKYIPVDGILKNRCETGGKNDLENVGPDRSGRRNPEDINKHRKGNEPPADTHDRSEHAYDDSAYGHEKPGYLSSAEVLIK